MGFAGSSLTGRDVAEYFTTAGPVDGLYGQLLASVSMSLIVGLLFAFAVKIEAYDYRAFAKRLVGPLWILFELVMVAGFLIVLAITGSASGAMLNDWLGLPDKMGQILIYGAIVILAFYGRELVIRLMACWSMVLYLTFIGYLVVVFSFYDLELVDRVSETTSNKSWWVKSMEFTFFSVILGVAMLFALRNTKTVKQAFIAGVLGVQLFMIPRVLFHLSFSQELPEVLAQPVPIYWVINKMNISMLLPIYTIVLIGTYVQSGSGIIQAINERVDQWLFERGRLKVSKFEHAGIAIAIIITSLGLAQIGIIDLVAKGYALLGYIWLILLIFPLLTVGIYFLSSVALKKANCS